MRAEVAPQIRPSPVRMRVPLGSEVVAGGCEDPICRKNVRTRSNLRHVFDLRGTAEGCWGGVRLIRRGGVEALRRSLDATDIERPVGKRRSRGEFKKMCQNLATFFDNTSGR